MAGTVSFSMSALFTAVAALHLIRIPSVVTGAAQTPFLDGAVHVLQCTVIITFFLAVTLIYLHLHAGAGGGAGQISTTVERLTKVTFVAAFISVLLCASVVVLVFLSPMAKSTA